MRDSRMSEGEKGGPALWQRRNCPLVCHHPGEAPRSTGEMQGLALIVACIDYMDNSLGKVNPRLKTPRPGSTL